ncbi:expressed unknown protein [Seminavis robusta]|uniref:Uncharacterized protein n=1 Tax=Seminavis robusta TaxID=568900 RepID=A0A9N8EAM9_9STRA|nr:expressed unknown protein [Seminavis robusta]|eukprot:Sro848_g210480.1 n/a (1733) ;mRNA; r:37880-43078
MAAASEEEEGFEKCKSAQEEINKAEGTTPKRIMRSKRRATTEGLEVPFTSNSILPKRSFSADAVTFHSSERINTVNNFDDDDGDDGEIRLGIQKNAGVKLQLQLTGDDNGATLVIKGDATRKGDVDKSKSKNKITLDDLLRSNHVNRRRRRQRLAARGTRDRWELRKSLSYGQMEDLAGTFHSIDIEDLKRSLHGVQERRRNNDINSSAASQLSISSFEEDNLPTRSDHDNHDEDVAPRPSLSSSELAQKLANMFEDALLRHAAGNKGGELQPTPPSATTHHTKTLIPQVRELIMKLSVQDMVQVVGHLDQSQNSQSPVRWNLLQDIIDPEHQVDWDGTLFTTAPVLSKEQSIRGKKMDHLHQSARSLRSIRSSSRSHKRILPGESSGTLLGNHSKTQFDSFHQQSWRSFRSINSKNGLHQSFRSKASSEQHTDDVSDDSWIYEEEEEESGECSSSSSYLRSDDGYGEYPQEDVDDNASEMSGFSLEAWTEHCDSSITFLDFWNSYETLEESFVTEYGEDEVEIEVATECGDDEEYEEIVEETSVMESVLLDEEEIEEEAFQESCLLVDEEVESEEEDILPPAPAWEIKMADEQLTSSAGESEKSLERDDEATASDSQENAESEREEILLRELDAAMSEEQQSTESQSTPKEEESVEAYNVVDEMATSDSVEELESDEQEIHPREPDVETTASEEPTIQLETTPPEEERDESADGADEIATPNSQDEFEPEREEILRRELELDSTMPDKQSLESIGSQSTLEEEEHDKSAFGVESQEEVESEEQESLLLEPELQATRPEEQTIMSESTHVEEEIDEANNMVDETTTAETLEFEEEKMHPPQPDLRTTLEDKPIKLENTPSEEESDKVVGSEDSQEELEPEKCQSEEQEIFSPEPELQTTKADWVDETTTLEEGVELQEENMHPPQPELDTTMAEDHTVILENTVVGEESFKVVDGANSKEELKSEKFPSEEQEILPLEPELHTTIAEDNNDCVDETTTLEEVFDRAIGLVDETTMPEEVELEEVHPPKPALELTMDDMQSVKLGSREKHDKYVDRADEVTASNSPVKVESAEAETRQPQPGWESRIAKKKSTKPENIAAGDGNDKARQLSKEKRAEAGVSENTPAAEESDKPAGGADEMTAPNSQVEVELEAQGIVNPEEAPETTIADKQSISLENIVAEDALPLSLELERAKQALEGERMAHDETKNRLVEERAKKNQLLEELQRLESNLGKEVNGESVARVDAQEEVNPEGTLPLEPELLLQMAHERAIEPDSTPAEESNKSVDSLFELTSAQSIKSENTHAVEQSDQSVDRADEITTPDSHEDAALKAKDILNKPYPALEATMADGQSKAAAEESSRWENTAAEEKSNKSVDWENSTTNLSLPLPLASPIVEEPAPCNRAVDDVSQEDETVSQGSDSATLLRKTELQGDPAAPPDDLGVVKNAPPTTGSVATSNSDGALEVSPTVVENEPVDGSLNVPILVSIGVPTVENVENAASMSTSNRASTGSPKVVEIVETGRSAKTDPNEDPKVTPIVVKVAPSLGTASKKRKQGRPKVSPKVVEIIQSEITPNASTTKEAPRKASPRVVEIVHVAPSDSKTGSKSSSKVVSPKEDKVVPIFPVNWKRSKPAKKGTKKRPAKKFAPKIVEIVEIAPSSNGEPKSEPKTVVSQGVPKVVTPKVVEIAPSQGMSTRLKGMASTGGSSEDGANAVVPPRPRPRKVSSLVRLFEQPK